MNSFSSPLRQNIRVIRVIRGLSPIRFNDLTPAKQFVPQARDSPRRSPGEGGCLFACHAVALRRRDEGGWLTFFFSCIGGHCCLFADGCG